MRKAPDYIQFYPTLRCNRSCEFCFNRAMPSMPDMSLGDFTKMLAVLARASVKTLDIIGGEPTMHPNIVQIIREAAACGFSVNISSNGTNIERLEEILAVDDHVTLGISINDQQTLGLLRGFLQKHMPVVKTLYRPDMDAGMINDILALSPRNFYLIYRDILVPEEPHAAVHFRRFLSAVEKWYSAQRVGTVFCSGFIPDTEHYSDLARVRCPAGTTKLGVMPDGSVYPCNLFFGKEEFLLGNILTDTFESIWGRRALDFFREFSGNDCPETSCTLHTRCHGGCPAHGLAHLGSLAAPEPRCIPWKGKI